MNERQKRVIAMKLCRPICLVVFVLLYFCSSSSEAGESFKVRIDTKGSTEGDEDAFVPTNEWQELKPGQKIPPGLHVRIDMTTGKKEAKFMDPRENTNDGAVAKVADDTEKYDERDKRGYTHEELSEALGKMGTKQEKEDGVARAQRDAEIREKFRSYDQLKEELDSMKVKLQTDYEVLDGLMSEYDALKNEHSSDNADKLAAVLEELEFHVHRYDTARDFAEDGGLTKIVLPALNSTHENVRAAAAFLTGSALQSNPKVQIAALEVGLVESFLRVMKFDTSGLVRRRALYALSGLVRNFPLAQKRLIDAGGLDVLASVFEQHGDDDRKMQLKIVTLLQDLVLEHQDAVTHMNFSNELHREKVRQYDSVDIATEARKHGFCLHITSLLFWPEKDTRDRRQDLSSAVSDAVPVRPEHDVVEKVLDAMRTFSSTCKQEFRASSLAICKMLRESYSELADKESAASHSDEADRRHHYYTQLAASASSICDLLAPSNSSEPKDEL